MLESNPRIIKGHIGVYVDKEPGVMVDRKLYNEDDISFGRIRNISSYRVYYTEEGPVYEPPTSRRQRIKEAKRRLRLNRRNKKKSKNIVWLKKLI